MRLCLQVGYRIKKFKQKTEGDKKPRNKVTQAEVGHLNKHGQLPPLRHLREFKVGCLPFEASAPLNVALGCLSSYCRSIWKAAARWPIRGCTLDVTTGCMHVHASAKIRWLMCTSSAAQLLDGVADYEPGQQLKVDEMFKEGDIIDVAGTSIGKGFQGERSFKWWSG